MKIAEIRNYLYEASNETSTNNILRLKELYFSNKKYVILPGAVAGIT